MQLVAHRLFHNGVSNVTCAMAGIELCLGIILRQSLCETDQLVLRLMAVQQMETTQYSGYRLGTSCQDVLQAIVGAACEKQPVNVESQLMTEIIGNVIPLSTLAEQMPVALGHGLDLWDMG